MSSSFFKTGKKIVAIGRNYVAHAKELNNPVPSSPFFFLKPTTTYLREGSPVVVPPSCDEVHHEVELAVVIGKTGSHIKQEDAMSHVAGYALALDMTARQLQAQAKKAGLPWTESKGYDTFCPISDFIPKDKVANPDDLELWLKVDGEHKQRGSTGLMIFKIPALIEHVSSIMTLEENDVILTGTPEGVGAVKVGQTMTAGITDHVEMTFSVARRS